MSGDGFGIGDERRDLDSILRQLGAGALIREAESAGLSPMAGRMRCPVCVDQGEARPRNAKVFAGGHARWFCHRCSTSGDLIDLLERARGMRRPDAIAHVRAEAGDVGGAMGPPPPAMPPPPAPDESDKAKPEDLERLWASLPREDSEAVAYIRGRGLDSAVGLGLVRFTAESVPAVAGHARRGYRVTCALRDVVGRIRGMQMRLIRPPASSKEPKVISLRGSVTSRAWFGTPELIEASPVVLVAEGLADTLAASVWTAGRPGIAVAGAAGKNFLHRLAEELASAGVAVTGKTFLLLAQNDRPANASRREFDRLARALRAAGADVAWFRTPDEYKDLAELLAARPDMAFPPPELVSVLAEPEEGVDPARVHVRLFGGATSAPARFESEYIGNNLESLVALLDGPSRESIFGCPGEVRTCEMTDAILIGDTPVADSDVTNIRVNLLKIRGNNGKPLNFTSQAIWDAVSLIAARSSAHPVREYLSGLTWDGVPRLADGLAGAIGRADDATAVELLSRWAISAVARAMRPGCKVDNILILIGGQGVRKSSFFRALAGESWFVDSAVDVHNKDAALTLRRAWIMEWPELDAIHRSRDASAVKAFLSSPTDTYRPPYGRATVVRPRSSVIVGTTNHDHFLFDETGNRRFWPVTIPHGFHIDLDYVEANRDQLWAEATALYRAGHRWWLEGEESVALEEHNQQYAREDVVDGWEPIIRSWIGGRTSVTVSEVLLGAIAMPSERIDRKAQMRVASVLGYLGFRRKRTMVDGSRSWRWELEVVTH